MNIRKISNTQFNGAYLIRGNGGKVKEAETRIENELKDKGKIHTVGYGYTAEDMPAYILVTTGEDTARYNRFAARNLQKSCDEIFKNIPEKPQECFDTRRDYLKYRVTRYGALTAKIIMENCGFEQRVKFLSADRTLNAIKNHKFDFENGKILA